MKTVIAIAFASAIVSPAMTAGPWGEFGCKYYLKKYNGVKDDFLGLQSCLEAEHDALGSNSFLICDAFRVVSRPNPLRRPPPQLSIDAGYNDIPQP